MSQRLQQTSPQTTRTAAEARAMVYLCECGFKWVDSPKPAWRCKCGRQLERRNGIIHAAVEAVDGNPEGILVAAAAGGSHSFRK